MSGRIVIVEDDESIRKLLEVAVSSHGYSPVSFSNASDALADMEREPPDVAILDIMMDGVNGVDAVKLMRRNPRLNQVPVIMLTAKDREMDKIVGLDAGADDYMTKPFSPLELCARVRALLRRAEPRHTEERPSVYAFGALRLNTATRELTLSGADVELTFKEFELLKTLVENRDRALSRAELLNRVWGDDYYGETRTLDIHIGTLRQKLGENAENSRYIKTVRGVGYRFAGERGE